jgi:hypothetical protein
MRDDDNPPDSAEPTKRPATTLPPAAKTAREIARGVKEIGIPVLLLVGAIMKIPHADEAFLLACLTSLVGHFALRKAEGVPDMETLIAAILKR